MCPFSVLEAGGPGKAWAGPLPLGALGAGLGGGRTESLGGVCGPGRGRVPGGGCILHSWLARAPLWFLLCLFHALPASVLPSHQGTNSGLRSPTQHRVTYLMTPAACFPWDDSHRYWGLGHISLGDTINQQRQLPCSQGACAGHQDMLPGPQQGTRRVLHTMVGGTGGQRPQEVSATEVSTATV